MPNNYLGNFVNSKKLSFLMFIFSLFLECPYLFLPKFWDHYFVPSLRQLLRSFLKKKVSKKFDNFYMILHIFFNFIRNFNVKNFSFFLSFSRFWSYFQIYSLSRGHFGWGGDVLKKSIHEKWEHLFFERRPNNPGCTSIYKVWHHCFLFSVAI